MPNTRRVLTLCLVSPLFSLGLFLAGCGAKGPDNVKAKEPAGSKPASATLSATPKTEPASSDFMKAVEKARTIHWTYEGPEGPEHWAELDPLFSVCSQGKEQSPIDLHLKGTKADPSLSPLTRDYKPSKVVIVNNGHTIQVKYDKGSTLTVDGKPYELLQYHFHAPSEHHVDGKVYPMEVHLVHRGEGGLAALGVFLEEGAENPFLAKIWAEMPKEKTERPTELTLNIAELLPKGEHYVTYHGSLTTPPCTESVRWFVMSEPIQVSHEQVEAFHALIHDDARPIQPQNERLVQAF
jgi:carbonic anhydrase